MSDERLTKPDQLRPYLDKRVRVMVLTFGKPGEYAGELVRVLPAITVGGKGAAVMLREAYWRRDEQDTNSRFVGTATIAWRFVQYIVPLSK